MKCPKRYPTFFILPSTAIALPCSTSDIMTTETSSVDDLAII